MIEPDKPSIRSWGGTPTALLNREARVVASIFGFEAAIVRHLRTSENRVWQVQHEGHVYALRCHRPPTLDIPALPSLSAAEIQSELQWLSLLSDHVSFPIPAPVSSCDGGLVISRSGSHWSLLRWVHGRRYKRGVRPSHLERSGRMVAELHAASRALNIRDLPRPRWDAGRLDAAVNALKTHPKTDLLPQATWDVIRKAQRKCSALFTGLNNETLLIHADLNIANLVFLGSHVSPIDFCSCGYGPPAFDIAQMLMAAPHRNYWDAFMQGYETGGGRIDASAIRTFAGMSFILWLNFNSQTSFRNITPRLHSTTQRMQELLS